MTFCWCTVIVKNMDESVKFYQDVLGLTLTNRFQPMPGTELAFFDAGTAQLELVCNGESPKAVTGDAVSLGFDVPSLDAALKMVQDKGLAVLGGPVEHPTVKFFFIQDPNGLKIQLKESIG